MSDRVRLNDVIRELIIESHEEENYLSNTKETSIIFNVRNAYATLIQDGKMSGYVLSLHIPINNGWKADLPEDYLRYVRIWGVDDEGGMHKLFVNGDINSSGEYLLDEMGNKLLDEKGIPLLGMSAGGIATSGSDGSGLVYASDVLTTGYGRRYNLMSGVKTKYGQYKISREDGIILISESPFNSIVLDYIADPVHFTEDKYSSLTMPKVYKEAVKALAYYNIIKRRRSTRVPDVEKQRAEREFEKLIRIAQLKSAPSVQEWRQYLDRSNGRY